MAAAVVVVGLIGALAAEAAGSIAGRQLTESVQADKPLFFLPADLGEPPGSAVCCDRESRKRIARWLHDRFSRSPAASGLLVIKRAAHPSEDRS